MIDTQTQTDRSNYFCIIYAFLNYNRKFNIITLIYKYVYVYECLSVCMHVCSNTFIVAVVVVAFSGFGFLSLIMPAMRRLFMEKGSFPVRLISLRLQARIHFTTNNNNRVALALANSFLCYLPACGPKGK